MAHYYLGIDIGGTKIKAVLLKGFSIKTMECFVIDTPKNKKQFLSVVSRLVRFVVKNKKLSGIGIGLPGIVDMKRGVLVKAPNLPFLNGWNAKQFFKKFARRISVDNDSRCFVRAEAAHGAAMNYKNIIGVTIGTGVGGGIMVDGKMFYGSRNGAGEFGHMIIDAKKTFEQLAGKKAYQKYGDRSEVVGIGVANFINAFDSDIVVLGGGGVTSGAVKLATVRMAAKKYIMSPLGKKTLIVKTKLGDLASGIGAAMLLG